MAACSAARWAPRWWPYAGPGRSHAFDTLNHFFLITEMIVPGSCYWNIGIGREPGEVEKDEEGIRTMRVLGRNMAWLLKKLGS